MRIAKEESEMKKENLFVQKQDDPATKRISRRTMLKRGAGALAGLTILSVAGPSEAFAQSDAVVIPWLDPPGHSTGEHLHRASTRFDRERATLTEISSRLPTTRFLPAREAFGRATDRSRVEFVFREPTVIAATN
jgi:hypothetical protein